MTIPYDCPRNKALEGVKAIMEIAVKEATDSLDSKLAYMSGLMTEEVMKNKAKNHTDDHLKTDIQGISRALRGEYKDAAKILRGESQYNENADVRKSDNGLVALANTMYAVSLLKDKKFDEAECLLKTERSRDLSGLNPIDHVKDLNKRALRLALLKQGKDDQVKYMDMTKFIQIRKRNIKACRTKLYGSRRYCQPSLVHLRECSRR